VIQCEIKDTLKNCIIWDVEVQHGPDEVKGGWDNPEEMKLASAVVWDYKTNRYHFYLHEESKPELLNHLKHRTCVGFNSVQFDTRVLLGNEVFTINVGDFFQTRKGDTTLEHIDLLLWYIRRYYNLPNNWKDLSTTLKLPEIHDGTFTLDALCEATLGERKCGNGAHAPKLYQNKEYDKLLEYNLQDVRLTKKLFEHVLNHGFVINKKQQQVFILP
jgi:hypothetical protein